MMDVPITQSFWQKGGFGGNNIWGSGTKAAPFDQPVNKLNYYVHCMPDTHFVLFIFIF
jgi:hypothetical protein